MNKSEFLSMLEKKLQSLPSSEIVKSISYFSEIIDDRVEDGMSEEEAIASLESMDEIVEKIMLDTPLPVLVKARMKSDRPKTPLNTILLIVGFPIWFPLLMAAFAVILSFYVSVWAVILSMYAVIFSLAVAGVVGIAASPLYFATGIPSGIFILGCVLLCLSLGILLFFPITALSKSLIKLTSWFLKKTKAQFIRKEVV